MWMEDRSLLYWRQSLQLGPYFLATPLSFCDELHHYLFLMRYFGSPEFPVTIMLALSANLLHSNWCFRSFCNVPTWHWRLKTVGCQMCFQLVLLPWSGQRHIYHVMSINAMSMYFRLSWFFAFHLVQYFKGEKKPHWAQYFVKLNSCITCHLTVCRPLCGVFQAKPQCVAHGVRACQVLLMSDWRRGEGRPQLQLSVQAM